jgi:hypothetical protein
MSGHHTRGFVLPFVVFMLFAISVAGVAGYLVVASEFEMSKYSSDGAEALTVARAGLERFVAEQIGTLPDTASYAMGDGVAVVTTRALFAIDSITDMVYLRSEATVQDIRSPNTPARRVVGAQAIHRRRPMPQRGALIISAATVNVTGEAYGNDKSTLGECSGGAASAITGAIARTSVSGTLNGSPNSRTWGGDWEDMLDSIRVRFDVLSDPNFPVDFENTLPSDGSLPADSFPIVRYDGGTVTPSTSGKHNKGVLIVTNTLRPAASFNWEGIVLAGNVTDAIPLLGGGSVDGILVGGLSANNNPTSLTVLTDVNYHACNVYGANESLAYLELLPNTLIETN